MESTLNHRNEGGRKLPATIKREGWALIELIALAGLAITQPLLETMKFNAAGLTQAGATIPALIIFTLIIIIGPASLLWAVEFTFGLLLPKFRPRLHNLLLGFLAAIIAFEAIGSKTALSLGALVAIATGVGLFAAATIAKYSTMRTFLRVLSIASPVFGALFLLSAPIQSVIPNEQSAANVHIAKPSRVVMIVMDEFSLKSLLDGTGQIDRELFPNFAALASDSRWYRNTTSVAPFTQVAVPALVSGSYPQHPTDIPTASTYPDTLFSLLGGTYSINSHEITAEHLCSQSLCPPDVPKGLGNIENTILRDAADLWWRFASPGPGATFKCVCDDDSLKNGLPLGDSFIRDIKPTAQPRLDYVHLLIPHAPWHLASSGQSYDNAFSSPRGLDEELKWSSQETAAASRQRHLLQLQAGDAFLGRVVTRLRKINAYDDSLIVLTADHGVSFKKGSGYRGIDGLNYPDILWVPLFIKEPGNSGGGIIDDRRASSIDVLPTIADALGAKLPWRVDGKSLLGKTKERPARKFLLWPSGLAFLAPNQAKYEGFSEDLGFAEVLSTKAVNSGSASTSRLYAIEGSGKFANLIGTRPDAILDFTSIGPDAIVTNGADYVRVVPTAKYAPWTLLRGGISGKTQMMVAVAVNGVISAISQTLPSILMTPDFSVPLPPKAFIPGANEIRLYVVSGTPDSPSLIPIRFA